MPLRIRSHIKYPTITPAPQPARVSVLNNLSRPVWTAEEDAIMRKSYVTSGAAVLAEALGRSSVSIIHRARHLGLCRRAGWTKGKSAPPISTLSTTLPTLT